MKKLLTLACFAMTISLVLTSCEKEPEDPFAGLEAILTYYEGDNFMTASGTSITLKSNRGLEFGFQEYSGDDHVKVELTRTINGTSSTCDMLDDEGNTLWQIIDWPGTSTDYTLTVHAADGTTKDFGPYNVTVESAGVAVSGSCGLSDQFIDSPTRGSFFESRHIGWGGGSSGNANYYSVLAQTYARLLDFGIATEGGALKAVSPDNYRAIHSFERLVNDCGYQSTKFAAYSGSLDPSTGDVTLEQILALDAPTESDIVLSEGIIFVYQTSDGKKGLIKVEGIAPEGDGTTCGIYYACEQ
jgi:hypothetical protein